MTYETQAVGFRVFETVIGPLWTHWSKVEIHSHGVDSLLLSYDIVYHIFFFLTPYGHINKVNNLIFTGEGLNGYG